MDMYAISNTAKEGNRVKVGHGGTVTLKLCERIAGKYYHIFFHYFSSVHLFKKKGTVLVELSIQIECWPNDLNKKAFKTKAKRHNTIK